MPNSEISSLRSPVAVVVHDAGAANLVIAWLRDRNDLELRVCAGGPAAKLWKVEFGEIPNLPFDEALREATVLVSGTSHSDAQEHKARQFAKQHGIRSVGVIDHWVNYAERFIRDGVQILPDEIWVADQHAYFMAEQCFPSLPIKQLANRYMERLVETVRAYSRPARGATSPSRVLYVLEPIRHAWASGDLPGEFLALDFFAQHMNSLGLPASTEVRLRPHPSDPEGKYGAWIERMAQLNVSIDSSSTLAEAIAWADMVVGCETFALVIAHHAGRPIVSTLPPMAPRCRLPIESLTHLRDLVSNSGAENEIL